MQGSMNVPCALRMSAKGFPMIQERRALMSRNLHSRYTSRCVTTVHPSLDHYTIGKRMLRSRNQVDYYKVDACMINDRTL